MIGREYGFLKTIAEAQSSLHEAWIFAKKICRIAFVVISYLICI